MEIEMCFLEFI